MNAIKQFGLGILYAVLFPLILVIAALVGIFGIFNFLYQGIVLIVNFFSGKPMFPPFKEDNKAYDILQKAIDKQNGMEEEKKEAAPASQTVYIQQNYYQQTPTGFIPAGQQGPQIGMNPNMNNGFIPNQGFQTPQIQQTPLPNNVQPDQIPMANPNNVIENEPKNDVELLNFPEGDKK